MIECAVFLKKLWSDVLSFEEKDRYLHSETVVERNCKTQTKAANRSSDRRERWRQVKDVGRGSKQGLATATVRSDAGNSKDWQWKQVRSDAGNSKV